MSKPGSRRIKFVALLIDAKNPYYIVRVYDTGRLVSTIKKIFDLDFIKTWFFYNQSLVEYGYVSTIVKRGGRTVAIVFDEAVSRHVNLFLFYLYSVSNLKSRGRVDCLAKCWSRIDAASPIVDVLLELSRMVESKRFFNLLRGYCLCQ